MIKFLSLDRCIEDENFISPVDGKFGVYLSRIPVEIIRGAAREIDHVEVQEDGTFTAKFLDTRKLTVSQLSSGCKAAVLAEFFKNDTSAIIDLRECGDNALRYVLATIDNAAINATIRSQPGLVKEVFPCDEVMLNGVKMDIVGFLVSLVEIEEGEIAALEENEGWEDD